MLLHISDPTPQRYWRLHANVFVADQYLAALWLDQSIETTKERRLSGAAFTDDRRRPSGGNVNAHIVQRHDVAESVRDTVRGKGNWHDLKSDRHSADPLLLSCVPAQVAGVI